MSDSDDYNRRVQARMNAEIAEMETPRARYQQILNRWVWEQRAAEAEERRMKRQLDPYGLGLYD